MTSRAPLTRAAEAPRAPGDPVVAWLRERALRAQGAGAVDEAMAYLERLVELARSAEDRTSAHLELGAILRDREEYGRSTAHHRAAADLTPHRADVLYELGLAHAYQENGRAAVDALRRAAALAPDDMEIFRALGVALAGMGEDDEAGRLLTRAYAAKPDDIRVLESLAMHHLKMGRFGECSEIVQRASRLAPDNRVVRRLAKEASYLVELAAAGAPQGGPSGRPLRVALSGAPAEVEHAFLEGMGDRFTALQRERARDLWRHYLEARTPRIRNAREHAAAVEFAIARLDFVDGCARDQVARRYRVEAPAVARVYSDLVEILDVAVFDPRYSTQPHPVEQISTEVDRSGLEAEDVFQALLEDEYRDYQESYERVAGLGPRLGRDEFEDASVEYGSLLTREMMGLTLARRERVRKRELERVLLVT